MFYHQACAGLPDTRKDHAVACVELATEMIAVIRKCFDRTGQSLQVRIGIHSGQVISGVVGLLRPQFSLFGDTVNMASRMESTGEDGMIHVSRATHQLLINDYRFQGPFKTQVKGKGMQDTYYILERISHAQAGLKHRRPSLVASSEDMLEDVKDLVPAALASQQSLYQIIEKPVNLHPVWLNFTGPDGAELEERYNHRKGQIVGRDVRRPIHILIIFSLIISIFDLALRDWDSSYLSRILLARYSVVRTTSALFFCFADFVVSYPFSCIRFIVAMIALVFAAFTWTRAFRYHITVYTTTLFILAIVGDLLIPILTDVSISRYRCFLFSVHFQLFPFVSLHADSNQRYRFFNLYSSHHLDQQQWCFSYC